MNVLVVFEDPGIRELMTFFLEGRFKVNVVEAPKLENALALLASDKNVFDGLVCDFAKSARKLISFAVAKSIDLHFFCASENSTLDPMMLKIKDWIHFFSNSQMVQGIEEQLKTVFKELQVNLIPSSQEYCRIQSHLLLSANLMKGNLYVRLSDQKYVRIMREGYPFDIADYDYIHNKKKIEYLYLYRELCIDFALQIQNTLLKKQGEMLNSGTSEVGDGNSALEVKKKRLQYLKDKAKLLEEDKLKTSETQKSSNYGVGGSIENKVSQVQAAVAQTQRLDAKRATLIQAKAQDFLDRKKKADILAASQAASKAKSLAQAREADVKRILLAKQIEKDLGADFEAVQKMGNELGFTLEVQEITKKSVMKTIQTVRNTPKLSALLSQLRRDKDKYLSSHSMLLAYISCAIASQMDWSSDTTFQKLTLAAFLHDVALQNHELGEIQSLGELAEKAERFTPEEIKSYKDHPNLGSEIARCFSEVPPDVDAIIAQHHERPDGSGFPRGLTHSRIGPLSAVFIVAHELVSYLFNAEKSDSITGINLSKFLESRDKNYQFGNFKKAFAVVPKIQT